MLLQIDVKKENIIFNKNGRIIIKLNYYSDFSIAAWLCTTKGETIKDFDKNKAKCGKNIFVGSNGGISVK